MGELPETLAFDADVPAEMHGIRLDQAAVQLFSDYSRSKLQEWILDGSLTVDGETRRPKDKVSVGQQLTIRAQRLPEVSWSGEDRPLDILFEDEHVIVVNKPAGLVVHPAAGHAAGTLVNALIGYAPELEALPRGGIVHRLDKETSGVMCVARSPVAHRSLVAQLSARTVKREYVAVCQGVLSGGGTIDQPIGRHPSARTKMAVTASGKPAITHYRVQERFAHHTAVQVNLETGRTHQIRVHMAWCKHPLVGDPAYGGRLRVPKGASDTLLTALRGFSRQALHAQSLRFLHPATNEQVGFDTELPADLVELLAVLKSEDGAE